MASFRRLLITIAFIADTIGVEDSDEASDAVHVSNCELDTLFEHFVSDVPRPKRRALGEVYVTEATKRGGLPEWGGSEGPAYKLIYLRSYRIILRNKFSKNIGTLTGSWRYSYLILFLACPTPLKGSRGSLTKPSDRHDWWWPPLHFPFWYCFPLK